MTRTAGSRLRVSASHALSVVVVSTIVAAAPCFGVDGVVPIDRLLAEIGGVTEGDAPGFPVTISESGSYRLTSDLRVGDLPTPAEITVIEVTADDVVIDLNGFSILSATVCAGDPISCSPIGPGRGIDASAAANVTVTNGKVGGMGDDGIALGREGIVADVHLRNNGGDGVQIGGGGRVSSSTSSNNGAAGVFVFGPATLVVGNTAGGNGGDGIHVRNGAAVEGNNVLLNDGDGIEIEGAGGLVRENVVLSNGGRGIVAPDAASGVSRNVIGLNDGGPLFGGTQLGANLCGVAVCP